MTDIRDSAQNRNLSPRLKYQAWDECRGYPAKAERDLRAALEHAPDPVVRDHVERDLEYLESLKQQAPKPSARRCEREISSSFSAGVGPQPGRRTGIAIPLIHTT